MTDQPEVTDPVKSEETETTPKETPEETSTEESVEDQLVKAKEENKKLYARTKQAEEGEKVVKDKLSAIISPVKETPSETPSTPTVTSDIEERVDLRMDGYSQDEIAFIKRNQVEGKSLAETAKLPYIEKGIEGMRADAKVEEATPPPSGHSPTIEGKKVSDMTPKEKQENLSFDSWRKRKNKVG